MAEIWDLYDETRQHLNKTHIRGVELKEDEYHLVVEIWSINQDGKILLTKRHPQKPYGNMWECTGGSVVSGEDTLVGAVRELEEETGLSVTIDELKLIHTTTYHPCIYDAYLVKKKFSLSDLKLQEEEVIDAKLVTLEEFEHLCEQGEIVPHIVRRLAGYKNKLFTEK